MSFSSHSFLSTYYFLLTTYWLRRYSGVYTLIHSNSCLATKVAPMVLSRGPFSIMIANANAGFSYGKNPTTHELTSFFKVPSSAVPVFPATLMLGMESPLAVPPKVTAPSIPSFTTTKEEVLIGITAYDGGIPF